jgi:predicted nucleotide-binding protein (sugar kinase/HSP70/actin superfamily)
VLSPDENNFFQDLTPEFTVRIWTALVAHDLLQAMLFDVRPVETRWGVANAIFGEALASLLEAVSSPYPRGVFKAVAELAGGMWGIKAIVAKAARDYGRIKNLSKKLPAVSVVGDIYIRLDRFANDFIVDKLEARGLRARLAPLTQWLEYSTYLGEDRALNHKTVPGDDRWTIALTGLVQKSTSRVLYKVCQDALGWPAREKMGEVMEASRPYVHRDLQGAAALSLGGPLVQYRRGQIEGAVIVGPHECMSSKITEAQYARAAQDHGIAYLSIPLNGDPIDTELLDRFAYDIRERFRRRSSPVVEYAQ